MSVATQPPLKTPTKSKDNPMARIIVLDDLAAEGLAKLESAEGITFDIKIGLKGEELREALTHYDGAVCRSGVKITAETLEGNKSLKAIVRAGVGTDNIDKSTATLLGIVVMNTPAGNTISTAEHTMALLLGLSRKIGPAYSSLQAGRWDRKKFKGSQVSGKTLGIVGLGRIGLEVASRARAFGMDVIGYDPFLSSERAEDLGITKVAQVSDLLPKIDYLTVHTPLTPETKGLIGHEEVKLMKPNARLVNCARGGIYDNDALIAGLESGQLGGVALDVYPEEPCTDNPLFQMDNVLCTPHLGASTDEAQIEVAVEAVDLLVNFLTTGEIKSAVNTISLDPKTLNDLRSHLDVAHRLGVLLGQWHGAAIEKCELEFQGDISEKDTRPLVSAFCAGLLGHVTRHPARGGHQRVPLRGALLRQVHWRAALAPSGVEGGAGGEASPQGEPRPAHARLRQRAGRGVLRIGGALRLRPRRQQALGARPRRARRGLLPRPRRPVGLRQLAGAPRRQGCGAVRRAGPELRRPARRRHR